MAKESKKPKPKLKTKQQKRAWEDAGECVLLARSLSQGTSETIRLLAPAPDVVPALHVDIGGRLLICGFLNEDPSERRYILDEVLTSLAKYSARAGIILNYRLVSQEG